MKYFVMLLLLVGCLSCVTWQLPNEDEQISEQMREKVEKKSEAVHLESWPLGMCSVVREMSAMLGEQRAELRHTQARLSALEGRLRESEAQIQELKTENQEFRRRDEELTRRFEELLKEHQVQSVKLGVLRDRSNITEGRVEELRKNNEVRKAAFSASLLGTGEGHVGPISTETTLIFGKILSNVGNAYNPYTGIFTAPVRGIYEFKLFVYNHATSSVSSGASLHKNGERLVTAYAHNDDRQHVSSSNSVIVLMEQGDVVFVRLWANRRIFDSKNHHSTFSGHILFPL
ncbi:complement C1q-like protein 2 [Pygocentrus nattereri]|uniref:complement C1q-like protein 2 n=1 Tax=Pygocentrus nattereri TaxID=42514 RepID=UPI001891B252|nr:complement C1q-like protein 2 [Pygocentrus nattereri]